MENNPFNGTIEPDLIYQSDLITTKYAAYSEDSGYIIVATDSWAGIYDSDSRVKTLFDYCGYLSNSAHIYALTVRPGQ